MQRYSGFSTVEAGNSCYADCDGYLPPRARIAATLGVPDYRRDASCNTAAPTNSMQGHTCVFTVGADNCCYANCDDCPPP